MSKLRPSLNSTQTVADSKGGIDPLFFQYLRAIHDVVSNNAAVPRDNGAWPSSASQIIEGTTTLWRNGSALRLYANVSGTLRYIAFT